MNLSFSRTLALASLCMLCSKGLYAAEADGAASGPFGDKLALAGLIEVEGSIADRDGGDTSSNIILSTFELGLEAKLNDRVTGLATLLYEEDGDDELLVDEAFIRVTPAKVPLFIEAGRITQAFGDFSTGMVADPVTLELAETKHHGTVTLGYEEGLFGARVSAFKADVQKGGDDAVNTIVAAFCVADDEGEELRYRVGASWINNIAATDSLSGDYEALDGSTSELVGGVGLSAMAGFGPVDLRAEYITALDEFADGDRAGRKPLAWNLEAEYAISEPLAVTLRYAGATDFDVRRQYGATIGYEFMENTAVALEYLRENGRIDEGVKGDRDLFTLQLAMEF
ncbi:LbtU family siderophore porin [Chlorobaculum sp. 24CR]|uniref:LbtU family siderophore porin n=1 Tax=Chlorobaculum sp. 24CR TaxID=2508878 RepID=UPI00100C0DA4|nr:LbtU family siderophore porin [Chlorobaculum sp. 24CR]RXK84341.1 LbtU family siderophore porin [Chlorobaculum sp. 24CR]